MTRKIGNDCLAAKRYKKAVIKSAIKGDVLGIMHTTFGDCDKELEAFAKSGKFSEIVDHLAPWDGSHKYSLKKYLPIVYKKAAVCEKIAKKYPNTVIMISPFCEHTHKRSDMQPVFAKLRQIAPTCIMVNSIIGAGQTVPLTVTEIHIESTHNMKAEPDGEYTISMDGFGGNSKYPYAMVDADMALVFKKYPRARHYRAWGSRHNGKWDAIKDRTVISKRKQWPSGPYLRGYRATLIDRVGSMTYSNNDLLKTFSDDHGQGGKDNKMLVIINKSGGDKVADVFDSKGNKIDSMRRVLPDYNGKPKGRRYYSSKYAVEIADKAVKNTGSPLVTIRSGKACLPPTDCYLRSSRLQ